MMAIRLMLSAAILLDCYSHEMRPPPTTRFPVTIKGEAITYETSRCSGRCPVFKVTVQPNGSGIFVGGRFTATPGNHLFWLTSEDYRAFAAKIAPYRPPSGLGQITNRHSGCENSATDMSGVTVTWQSARGVVRKFRYYDDCNNRTGDPVAVAMRAAPHLLPIDDFVGWRCERR
jgi:hypothetical protein